MFGRGRGAGVEMASTGVENITQGWGRFATAVRAGRHHAVTWHHRRDIAVGEPTVIAVAVDPAWYDEHLKTAGLPDASEARNVARVRGIAGTLLWEIYEASQTGTSRHLVVLKGGYEAHTRTVRGQVKEYPAKPGTPSLVFVDTGWYTRAGGVIA